MLSENPAYIHEENASDMGIFFVNIDEQRLTTNMAAMRRLVTQMPLRSYRSKVL